MDFMGKGRQHLTGKGISGKVHTLVMGGVLKVEEAQCQRVSWQ